MSRVITFNTIMCLVLTIYTMTMVACNEQHLVASPSLESHSCPKPGHGPCYLCDN